MAGMKEAMFGYKDGSLTIAIGVTLSGLAKVAIFTTNVDAEHHIFFNHKCVCGELNRHFCQTRVMPSASHFIISTSLCLALIIGIILSNSFVSQFGPFSTLISLNFANSVSKGRTMYEMSFWKVIGCNRQAL
jgi:hypothetical protein